MNSLISIFLAGACALSSGVAESFVPPVQTSFNINVSLMPDNQYNSSDSASFTLYDGENTYLSEGRFSQSDNSLSLSFLTNGYYPGKSFTLTPVSGVESIVYNGNEYGINTPINVSTSYTKDENGEFSVINSVDLAYIPTVSETVYAYYNNTLMDTPAKYVDGTIMLPVERTAQYMKASVSYDSAYESFTLSNKNSSLILFCDNIYTVSNGTEFNANVAPFTENGIFYADANIIASAFGADFSLAQHNAGFDAHLNFTPPETPEEAYVNSAGLKSDTPYLIWVSKSSYRVHVFLASQGQWSHFKTLRCSIGAPSTPTCEGTYKYYEPIAKWDYGSYYVGPVMRFNRGYALHSTIINKNGTMRDGRLEQMVSHGCVRIDPPDMNWLFSIIPLYTTVHVTP